MSLPVVQCVHWNSGSCALGKFGGRPSPGVCNGCPAYAGPGTRILDWSPPAPESDILSPDRVVQVEQRKEDCTQCTEWMGQFLKIPGTNQDGYTKCAACRCAAKRVSLLTGGCPRKIWSN